jgi:hypothetical protein
LASGEARPSRGPAKLALPDCRGHAEQPTNHMAGSTLCKVSGCEEQHETAHFRMHSCWADDRAKLCERLMQASKRQAVEGRCSPP